MADTWRRWSEVAEEEKILSALPRKVRTRLEAVQSAMSLLGEAVTEALKKGRK